MSFSVMPSAFKIAIKRTSTCSDTNGAKPNSYPRSVNLKLHVTLPCPSPGARLNSTQSKMKALSQPGSGSHLLAMKNSSAIRQQVAQSTGSKSVTMTTWDLASRAKRCMEKSPSTGNPLLLMSPCCIKTKAVFDSPTKCCSRSISPPGPIQSRAMLEGTYTGLKDAAPSMVSRSSSCALK